MNLTVDENSFARAQALLTNGDYAEGWPLYETRPNRFTTNARQLSYPEWRGEDLAGKRLLVWPEQGFGDQIMAARFLNRTGAAKVSVATRPPLARLLAPLVDAVVDLSPGSTGVPRHDLWALAMSLPYRLGARADNLPSAPYLAATEVRTVGSIGVSWRGEPSNALSAFRALPEAQARRLLSLPGAVDLDPAVTGARDFQDTANIIAGLDLVISIDTANAHLAGAMGANCWTLLSTEYSEWRWMRERTDSPWYPTMRLWRQPEPGAWAPVIDEVLAALA